MSVRELAAIVRERSDAAIQEAGEIAGRIATDGGLEPQLQLEQALDDVDRYARIAGHVSEIRVKSEPLTYTREGRYSHARDMACVQLKTEGMGAASERLARHAREMEVEGRAGSTVETAGGTFVPPIWVLDQYMPAIRANRVAADLANLVPLPVGTDQLPIPTVTTGNVVDVQATENTAITSRDMITSSTTADVITVTGQFDCSLQLSEQSLAAGSFDAIVYKETLADYNRKITSLVLNGTGASNQPYGLATVAGTSVTVSATTANAVYAGLGDAASRLSLARQRPPEIILMHPRRWWWLATRMDTAGGPVVQQDPVGALELLARRGIEHSGAGIVGHIGGLVVAIDDTISTTTSTYFDDIFVWKPTDAFLWESLPKLAADRGVLSDTGGVRYKFYRYAAFSTRTSTSIAALTGAGLTSPTF